MADHGDTVEWFYVNTLRSVDIGTGWVEYQAEQRPPVE